MKVKNLKNNSSITQVYQGYPTEYPTTIGQYLPNMISVYEQGWVCPICGAVMNPHERSCINCKGNTYK